MILLPGAKINPYICAALLEASPDFTLTVMNADKMNFLMLQSYIAHKVVYVPNVLLFLFGTVPIVYSASIDLVICGSLASPNVIFFNKFTKHSYCNTLPKRRLCQGQTEKKPSVCLWNNDGIILAEHDTLIYSTLGVSQYTELSIILLYYSDYNSDYR